MKNEEKRIATNKQLSKETIAISTPSADEFNKIRDILILKGYNIVTEFLDKNDGNFKVFAKIEKETKLKKCALIEKKIPDHDRCYPTSYNSPNQCIFYMDGQCTCCMNDNYCLFIASKEHIEILKDMVKVYSDNREDREYLDNQSSAYTDTIFGRIYSEEYEHLNSKDIRNKVHNIGRGYISFL